MIYTDMSLDLYVLPLKPFGVGISSLSNMGLAGGECSMDYSGATGLDVHVMGTLDPGHYMSIVPIILWLYQW